MANLLDFLRDLLASPREQQTFAADAVGYLAGHGFGDLTGEDVAEAVSVVAPTLPEPASRVLGDLYEGGAGAGPDAGAAVPDAAAHLGPRPPIAPGPGETAEDAAIRHLRYVIAVIGATTDAGGEAAEG
jgi:hypothetical protein